MNMVERRSSQYGGISEMRNTKLFRLLAVLFAVSLVAAACGSEAAEEEAASEEVAEEEASTEETSEEEATEEGETEEVEVSQGDTVSAIIDRGELNCGVSGQAVAFSVTQPDGSQVGFDADYCRAVAAAILGDAEAVNFVPLTSAERFTAVQTGTVDVLMRNTTWTQSRDTDLGMDFGPTTYFDGQQLMARVSDGFSEASTVADIDGALVCTQTGTTTEKNIVDAANAAGVTITLQQFEEANQVQEAFTSGACDVFTTDGSALVGRKAELQPADQEWVIFPSSPISKEPLGPTYGQNDSVFADIVNWTVYATLIADENGVNSGNVADVLADTENTSAEVLRLLGGEGELQTLMGLEADAFYNVIEQVGAYSEIYERHLGPVGLTIEGSFNALWTDGGLMYPPPAR